MKKFVAITGIMAMALTMAACDSPEKDPCKKRCCKKKKKCCKKYACNCGKKKHSSDFFACNCGKKKHANEFSISFDNIA